MDFFRFEYKRANGKKSAKGEWGMKMEGFRMMGDGKRKEEGTLEGFGREGGNNAMKREYVCLLVGS